MFKRIFLLLVFINSVFITGIGQYLRAEGVQVYKQSSKVRSKRLATTKDRNFRVVYPNGGERIGVPGRVTIRWIAPPNIEFVKIIPKKGGQLLYFEDLFQIPNTGSYIFDMTENAVDGKDYKIRIEHANNSAKHIESEGFFEIYHKYPPSIKISKPMGGEKFPWKSQIKTCWVTRGIDYNVKVELKLKGSGFTKVITETYDGHYPDCFDWIPHNKEVNPAMGYYIRISSKHKPGIFTNSNSFDIVKAADLWIYSKDLFNKKKYTTGAQGDLRFFIRNNGPDSVDKIKVKIWSLVGKHLHTTWKQTTPPTFYAHGRTGTEKIINRRLGPNGELEQKFSVEIKDKNPGIYTICLKVMSADNKVIDPEKRNDINSGTYQVIYQLKPVRIKKK
jgi:hypothetical protein